MTKRITTLPLLSAAILAILLLGQPVAAREFRAFNAIPAPTRIPDGATPVSHITPVNSRIINHEVRKVAEDWNNQGLSNHLSTQFHDAERLVDNVQVFIPRDAKLRVLSIQNQQTLQQYKQDGMLVSRVSVIANTQVEFNHPTAGFQKFPGRTEMTFKVRQK